MLCQNIKHRITMRSNNCMPRYTPERTGNEDLNRYVCVSVLRAALVMTAKRWKEPIPTDGWRNKVRSIPTVGQYSALGKEVLAPATAWTDLEDTVMTEVSQTQEDNTVESTCT